VRRPVLVKRIVSHGEGDLLAARRTPQWMLRAHAKSRQLGSGQQPSPANRDRGATQHHRAAAHPPLAVLAVYGRAW